MKILVAGSVNEYSCYEEEQLVKSVAKELKNAGHKVDDFILPYKPDALSLPDQALAYRLVDTSEAELLITIGYPACFMNHPNKICYLMETAPMLHEYWDTEYGVLGNYQYSQILVTMNNMEKKVLSEAKAVFANSALLSEDIFKRTGIKAELLLLPLLEPKEVSGKNGNGRYFVVETNLLQNSRYYEFVEQLSGLDDSEILMYIPNTDLVYSHALEEQIKRLNLNGKIRIINGEPSDSILANSLGYLQFNFNSRRIDNAVNRCMAVGAALILADDCGAALEYASGYDGARIVKFDKMVKFLNGCRLRQCNARKNGITDFVSRMVKI